MDWNGEEEDVKEVDLWCSKTMAKHRYILSKKQQKGEEEGTMFVVQKNCLCVCACVHIKYCTCICVTYWHCIPCRIDILSMYFLWLCRTPIHIRHSRSPLCRHTQLACTFLTRVERAEWYRRIGCQAVMRIHFARNAEKLNIYTEQIHTVSCFAQSDTEVYLKRKEMLVHETLWSGLTCRTAITAVPIFAEVLVICASHLHHLSPIRLQSFACMQNV